VKRRKEVLASRDLFAPRFPSVSITLQQPFRRYHYDFQIIATDWLPNETKGGDWCQAQFRIRKANLPYRQIGVVLQLRIYLKGSFGSLSIGADMRTSPTALANRIVTGSRSL